MEEKPGSVHMQNTLYGEEGTDTSATELFG